MYNVCDCDVCCASYVYIENFVVMLIYVHNYVCGVVYDERDEATSSLII